MATEGLSENPEWRAKQRERERERRRIRDRQRRQSMSVEEREKHLERRRKNYQLRRKRSEVNTTNGLGLDIRDEHLALVPITELHAKSNDGITSLGIIEAYENQNKSSMKFEGTEMRSHKYPRKLKLRQIRHLARLLNTSLEGANTRRLQLGQEFASSTTITTKCESTKGIRLVHVKRLARALSSPMKRALDENPFSPIYPIQGNQDMLELCIQTISSNALENENLGNTSDDHEL